MRTITSEERRARLVGRHGLTPARRAPDAVEAARTVVALHATDPATVYLSAWARTESLTVDALEGALYRDRSLVKHLAMRRTLFVFPRELLPAAQAGASARVAAAERGRLIRQVEKAGLRKDGARWLRTATRRVTEALAGGREASSTELREEIPELRGSISFGEGRRWGAEVPVGPRVLTTMSASGLLVRASNDGAWTTSRPRWTSMESWLGEQLTAGSEAEGVAELVARWLLRFGPGTEADIKWWLGGTATAVRRALAALGAVEVDLGGRPGYLHPDDLEPVAPEEPAAALLPGLDPTTMGWLERDWYLGEHRDRLFDRNGNGGATAWWDGRIVGGWYQLPDGEVVLQPLEPLPGEALEALEHEAQRLTDWLGGTRVQPRFPSPLAKEALKAT